jgi:hypothetical protein
MKCIVTGHTNGIGKSIYQHFIDKGFEVYGMSRSNGYDITKQQSKIIAESSDCDIFVNCAYSDLGQLNLLNALHNKVKAMIVIGSAAADYHTVWKNYGYNKYTLQERCKAISLQNDPTFAKIFYIKLAFCENANLPIKVDPKYITSFNEINKVIDLWLEIPKIYSVEFTIKETEELLVFSNNLSKND